MCDPALIQRNSYDLLCELAVWWKLITIIWKRDCLGRLRVKDDWLKAI